MNDIVENIL